MATNEAANLPLSTFRMSTRAFQRDVGQHPHLERGDVKVQWLARSMLLLHSQLS